MEGYIIGLRRGAWVIWASEGEGRCAQSQSYEGCGVESGGFCFQIEGIDDTNRRPDSEASKILKPNAFAVGQFIYNVKIW